MGIVAARKRWTRVLASAVGAAMILVCEIHAQSPNEYSAPPHARIGTSGPTIVVLHGGPGLTHDYLVPEWSVLASEYRLVLYDQMGCGRGKGKLVAGVGDLLVELAAVIDSVSPSDPVIVAGSSWGSHLAAHFAMRQPDRVRALILSGIPAAILDPAESEPHSGVGRLVPLPNRVERVGGGRLTPEQWAERESVVATLQSRVLEDCEDVRQILLSDPAGRVRLTELRNIDVPTLWFSDDLFEEEFSESVLAPQHVSGTEIRIVGGGGHDPWFTHSGDFFDAVRSFVGEVVIRR